MATSIPVQPGETEVTAALRLVTKFAGGIVTSTTRGNHATGSYHYIGRAVDIALPTGPSWDSPKLAEVAAVLLRVVPIQFITEFIWSGPNPVYIKHGKRVAPYAVAAHHNHIHFAATSSFTYKEPTPVPDAPAPPVFRVNAPVVGIAASYDGDGNIKGYLLVGADGGVFAFGEGARYLGRVEFVLPPNDSWTPAAV